MEMEKLYRDELNFAFDKGLDGKKEAVQRPLDEMIDTLQSLKDHIATILEDCSGMTIEKSIEQVQKKAGVAQTVAESGKDYVQIYDTYYRNKVEDMNHQPYTMTYIEIPNP